MTHAGMTQAGMTQAGMAAAGVARAGTEGPMPTAAAGVDPGIDRAWTWVRSMLRTPTLIESASVISPEREYPADWTGRVRGTFVLAGVQPPPVIPASVVLDAGSAVSAGATDFRGIVTGHITLPPLENRWIVQPYRQFDGQRLQVPVQTLVRPDGTFEIDLTATVPGPGDWQFGLLDAAAGYAPSGLPWPSVGSYQGWEVRSYATTDRRYFLGAQPASADGTFDFPASAPGTKSFQLVALDPGAEFRTEHVLAEHAPATGLVRSVSVQVGAEPGDDALVTSHSYDQALALQTALVMGDLPTARILAGGLIALQTTSGGQAGGFISTAPQANPAGGEAVYRTGNTAVALYALVSYLRHGESSDPVVRAARRSATAAADWLIRQQLTAGPMAGLLTGGAGGAGAAATDPAGRLTFASTEHNVDAWQALALAGRELPCATCAVAAGVLRAAILQVLWDPTVPGFTQGMRPAGRDTVDPLDVNSWGSIFLAAVERPGLAAVSLHRAAAFAVADGPAVGYLAFRPQPAIPDPVPSVWFEGSFGVALAQARVGNAAAHHRTLARLRPAQRPDGSFPMATTADSDRELTTESAVAATSWYILASTPDHPDALWASPPR